MAIIKGRRRSGGAPKGTVNNPTGKGGFKERPQDMNRSGRWKKEDSISYQYNMLIRLTVSQFKKWLVKFPEKTRTMAQELAYQAVLSSRTDIRYLEEITDRTEGKAPQTISHEGELKSTFDDDQINRIAERIAGRKR
jgi:hypothetical protein